MSGAVLSMLALNRRNLMKSSIGGTSVLFWVLTSHSDCRNLERDVTIRDISTESILYCPMCLSPEMVVVRVAAS